MKQAFRPALYVVVLVALFAGCTSPSGERSNSPVTREPTAPVPSAAPVALRCEKPPPALLERAKEAISNHTGPVRASVIVEAATTDTGNWSVIAVDRAYVYDDGTLARGGSRSLGLTDSAAAPMTARMIPIGQGDMRGVPRMSWQGVSWAGDTLEAGKRAALKAVECLDVRPR